MKTLNNAKFHTCEVKWEPKYTLNWFFSGNANQYIKYDFDLAGNILDKKKYAQGDFSMKLRRLGMEWTQNILCILYSYHFFILF